MDISVGSTRVPESHAYLSESVPRDGNRESSTCEQNQSQPHAARTQSEVRFKIRSAKERQQLFNSTSSFNKQTFGKASTNINEHREEMPRVPTISPPSPDTDSTDKRRPRLLHQVSLTKPAEVSVGSETSSDTQKKTGEGRERAEWRETYLSNRSKSLDLRGSKPGGGHVHQTDVIRNTEDAERISVRRSESLERNNITSRPNSNEVAHPLKKVSLKIQTFSVNGQRTQDSSGLVSPPVSVTSPIRTVALAQPFPSRLKTNQSQDRTDERRNPRHSEYNATKSDQPELHVRSQVHAPKVNEITGHQNIMGRYGRNALEDISTKTDKTELHIRSQVHAPKVNEITGHQNITGRHGRNALEDISTKTDQTELHVRSQVTAPKFNENTRHHAVIGRNGHNVLEESSTKTDQTELHVRSQVTAPKVNEITGHQNIMGKTDHDVLADNNQANSGVLPGFITPTPFPSFHATDSNLSHSKPTNSSLDKWSSNSSFNKVKTVSYNPEKGGTFPKAPFKKGQMNFTTLPETNVLHKEKDNFITMSTLSNEKPLAQESRPVVTNSSTYDEKRLTGQSIGFGYHSLGRTRNRYLTTPISYSAYEPSSSYSIQQSTRTKTEGQVEKMTSNPNQTKGIETMPVKPHSSQEGVIPLTKPQSSQIMTTDKEIYHQQKYGYGFEFGSLGNPSKNSEVLLEKAQAPSLDSVRNTIHKFEALAQQSQSSSRTLYPRRAVSVIEKPKVVATVNKTYSDRPLGIRSGDWNRENLRENLFTKSDVNATAVSIHDQSGPVQITSDKEVTAMQSQSRGIKSQESGVVHMNLLDETPSDLKNEVNFTTTHKHLDEPDFSKGNYNNNNNLYSYTKPKNTELTDKKSQNYYSSAMSHNSQNPTGITNASEYEFKDLYSKPESKISKSTKDYAFPKSQYTPVLPNSHSSTALKSTLLTNSSAQSKSPPNLLSDPVVIPPFQGFSPALGDLSNSCYALKDEKATEKVIRWIMDKGVDYENGEDDYDDEDDEGTERGYDSDSAESTVTITSNTSSRSFSMSFVDICSLGGLDLPPSDSSGSKDDENWMPKRTVSMSSDVSALSSVTLLDMEELDCLLNDVRNLDDEVLESYEDVHVVVLHKEPGGGLGFTVAGGVDQNKPVTVHRVLRNGVAAQEGSIHVGDQVLSINGTALQNSTHKEALNTMTKARGRTMTVVVIRRGEITDICLKDSQQKAPWSQDSRIRVILNKSSSDLGFSLEGGVGSSLGDKPLTVQRLFQGGPVGKVFPGDELLEVEGQNLEGLRRLEVWHLIKRLPPGPVEVLLQRPGL